MTLRECPAATAGPASRRQWAGLFFIALGVAIIIVDATIVNVAVPQIIKDLGITSSDAQWVQEVYTLVFAALLLAWGRLGGSLRPAAAVRRRGGWVRVGQTPGYPQPTGRQQGQRHRFPRPAVPVNPASERNARLAPRKRAAGSLRAARYPR